MRKLLLICIFMMPATVFAETFYELLDSAEPPLIAVTDQGVIIDIDLATRVIEVSGYSYHVSPAFGEAVTEISLYGTPHGSLELLTVGMKVDITYLDLGHARAAIAIKGIDPNLDVEN